MSPLLFDNGWTDHNVDYCINTIYEKNLLLVAMVTDLWHVSAKIDTPCLHFVRWHLTTVGKIAKQTVNSALMPSTSCKNFVNIGAVISYLSVHLQGVGGCT